MPTPNGPQFNSEYEMVPISILKAMRTKPLDYDVTALSEDIKTNGVREPGTASYNQNSRRVAMTEGHHRLAAAEMAGLTHIPMLLNRHERKDFERRGIVVRGVTPDKNGYVPNNLLFADVMDIEEN